MCTTRRVLSPTYVREAQRGAPYLPPLEEARHNEARPISHLMTDRHNEARPISHPWETGTTRRVLLSVFGRMYGQLRVNISNVLPGRWEEGGVYTPPYHPGRSGSHTIPCIPAFSTLLGGPQHAYGCTGWSALRHRTAGVTVKRRGALEGELPWVGASCCPSCSQRCDR